MQMTKMTQTLTAIAVAVGTSACLPDNLAMLDGKPSLAQVENKAGQAARLIDDQGRSFSLESNPVQVTFEMNWFSDSELKVSTREQTATFVLDEDILSQQDGSYMIPARQSGQPADLHIKETAEVLSQWIAYNEVSTPIYMSMPDGNGGYTNTITGWSTDYYRDTEGQVERGVTLALSRPGSEVTLTELRIFVRRRAETLKRQSISYSEYRKNRK